MNIDDLEKSEFLIYKTLSGSHSYNLNTESSDEDFKGIFVVPPQKYLSLRVPHEQINDTGNDVSYYSLRRFLELASTANPNIIEMLFVDEKMHKLVSPEMSLLLQQRQLFISKACVDPHLRYAEAQIKKAKGRNKWVNNPQQVERPTKKNFCWVTRQESELPFRPKRLDESKLNLAQCEVSSLEHHKGVYRLYQVGASGRGVFSKDGQIKCQSISQDCEKSQFWGLLTFNEDAYEKALKDHRHYWQWVENRNESRWIKQESGELDYDAKNMMHTLRLLYSGINILENNAPLVSFSGEKRDFLLAVRAGKFSYKELIEMAEELAQKMRHIVDKSNIQDGVDKDRIDSLHFKIYEAWQERTAYGYA